MLPRVFLILLWAVTDATRHSTEEMKDVLSAATNIGVQMCAARCFEIRSCKSFAFKGADLTCHLLSLVKRRHLDGFKVIPRVKMLDHPCAKTRCDAGTRCVKGRQDNIACINGFKSCGIPMHTLGAEVIYGDLFLGDKAEFTCQANHRPCTARTTSTCLSTGKWEDMTDFCGLFRWEFPDQMPFETSFPCGGQRQFLLSIHGRLTGEHSMTFVLKKGLDILMYLSCRKNYPERKNENNMMVTNSKINSKWGYEKKHKVFPFEVNRRFVLDITLQDGMYKVTVNGKTYVTVMEELAEAQPDTLRVVGDVKLESVRVD